MWVGGFYFEAAVEVLECVVVAVVFGEEFDAEDECVEVLRVVL